MKHFALIAAAAAVAIAFFARKGGGVFGAGGGGSGSGSFGTTTDTPGAVRVDSGGGGLSFAPEQRTSSGTSNFGMAAPSSSSKSTFTVFDRTGPAPASADFAPSLFHAAMGVFGAPVAPRESGGNVRPAGVGLPAAPAPGPFPSFAGAVTLAPSVRSASIAPAPQHASQGHGEATPCTHSCGGTAHRPTQIPVVPVPAESFEAALRRGGGF